MKLRYLLDTNICIYIANKKPINVLHKFEQLAIGEVAMSTITYGELFFGAQHSHHVKKNLAILEELTGLIPPLPMPTEAGRHYGDIRETLHKQGNMIGNNDLWIAAHALATHLTLITHNTKEFSRIKQLKIENWVVT